MTNTKYLPSSNSEGEAEVVLSNPLSMNKASQSWEANSNEFKHGADEKPFNGDINDRDGEEGNEKSKPLETEHPNLSLPFPKGAHLGFHDHPITTPTTRRKTIHIGHRNTIKPVYSIVFAGLSNNSGKASIKAIPKKKETKAAYFFRVLVIGF